MIAIGRYEYLRLVAKAPECTRMDDTVAIALKRRSRRRGSFEKAASA
jgi:hypothetical protein